MSHSGLPTKTSHRMEESSPKNRPDVSKCTLQGKTTVRLMFSESFQRRLTMSWAEITGPTHQDVVVLIGLPISSQQTGFHQAACFLAGSTDRIGLRSTSSLQGKIKFTCKLPSN